MNMTEARQKAAALVAQMTPEEKISQLLNESPAIERLGIHEYNCRNGSSRNVYRNLIRGHHNAKSPFVNKKSDIF